MLPRRGVAIPADAAENEVMVEDGDPGGLFERGEIARADQAGNGDQLAASCAVKMVMMSVDQLEPCPAIVKDYLADRARRGEFLGAAEDRGKIRAHGLIGEIGL
jgi:hypothetical protein